VLHAKILDFFVDGFDMLVNLLLILEAFDEGFGDEGIN
jgi:hypothetical protein